MADNIQKNVEVIFQLIDKTSTGASSMKRSFRTVRTSVNDMVNEVQRFRKEAVSAFNEAGLSASQLGLATAGVGAALTAPFVLASKEAATFEESMSAVKAISGATTAEFDALTRSALKMGRETRYTAAQSADALKYMSMAGLEASQSLASIPSVLQLATAGNLDLAQSADIATNVMTAYNIEAERLNVVNDKLVTAFTNSNSTLIELSEGFKYVGPIANGVGEEFDDLVSSLAMLHNAGIKSTMAGTTLRGVLDALFNPTAQEAELLQLLSDRIGGVGLQLNNAEGDFVGFQNLVAQLERSGITAAEALKLFGQRAGPGMVALMQQGSDAIGDFNQMMETSSGTAERIASTMDDNTVGAFRRLMSAVSGLGISIGNNFLPVLSTMADVLASLIVLLTEVHDALGPVAGVIEILVAVFGSMVLAVGAATLAYTTFIGPVGKALTILYSLAAAGATSTLSISSLAAAFSAAAVKVRVFFAALGPIGWLMIGLGTAISAVVSYMNIFSESTEDIIDEQNQLQQELSGVIKTLDRYERRMASTSEFTEKWSKANLDLRDHLLKLGNQENSFSSAALEAAYSIDATTGAILDNGEAIKGLKLEVATANFKSLSTEIQAIGTNLSNVSNEASRWDKMTGHAEFTRKAFSDLKKEVSDYKYQAEGLNERQEATRASFSDLTRTARQYVLALRSMGDIDVSGSYRDLQMLESTINSIAGDGWNMDLAVEAVRDQYDQMVKAAKASKGDRTKTEAEIQADLRREIIKGYKGTTQEIENAATARVLAERETAAKRLADASLSDADRERIAQASANRLLKIEQNKYAELKAETDKYYAALKVEDPSSDAAVKAAQTIVDLSNKTRELEIQDTEQVTEQRRELSERELEEVEARLQRQLALDQARASEAVDILKNEYSEKTIAMDEYFNKRKALLVKSQSEELKVQEELLSRLSDSNDIDEKQNEIALLKIDHAKRLRDLTNEQREAQKTLADAEIEAINRVEAIRSELVQNDSEAGFLERLQAKYSAAETELMLNQERELEIYRKAGVDKDVLDCLTAEHEKQTLALRKQQQSDYYNAIAVMSKTTAGQAKDTFAALYEATGKKHKELFYAMKAASLAEAVISTYLGATKALAQPGGYIGMALAGLIMAQGMANVAIISSQGMAEGGWVGGVSPNDKADNVGPIWLTAKEYVMPVATGREYGDVIMNAFRARMFPKEGLMALLGMGMRSTIPKAPPSYRLAEGGPVPSQSAPSSDSVSGITIINVVDPSIVERYNTSDEGKQSVLNVISDKAAEVKNILNNA